MKSFALALSLVAGAALSASIPSQSAYAADKKGSFKSHGSYKVRGNVSVSDNGTITLSGFKSTNGPDLYIYVGNGSPSKLVAKLKSTSGGQSYKIPASLAASISTVHVHCKRYSKVFGTAKVN